ncbi:helix-turn-helix domain-containing protein [Streptomyces sp. MMS21 TC-5]|uniref:helix-turn-helix domain-containing protein n=1 Tax=Streptomyces TaxID=1883 RepID=UPI001F61A918|nr:helix-turn-helix domain-containing protein [Streptomyces sp. MMS21 TC-5]MCI4079569.1 helix-turn-helix domain-containing protein [Streptomyces sp. MMS21 TC-5]
MTRPPDVHGIDPSSVTTPRQLAEQLERLRVRAGLSYAQMAERAGRIADGGRCAALSRASAHGYATGAQFPTPERLLTYLMVCQVPLAAIRPWMAALERARPGRRSAAPGAVRVREALPQRLGVRLPIEFEEARDETPGYVMRDLDEGLRAALAAASRDGGFLLLNGRSCVGKTRTLHEAVLEVLPEWWLVQPAGPEAIRELAAAPTPRTVLWLDELQAHLGTADPLTEGTVRTLLHAGTVIVGTIWTTEYQARVLAPRRAGDARGDEERRLLGLARVFDVADAFTPAEHARALARAGEDRWVRAALDSADTGFTQVLAAAPDLVRRWECAPDPYAEHVITAAVDARRLGVHGPVSEEFLRAAVRGYLGDRRAVAPPDWLRSSLDYATAPVRGVAPALMPCTDGDLEVATGYIATDCLLQRARETRRVLCPGDAVWRALSEHCHDPADLQRLARAAGLRMRYEHAAAFHRRLFDRGDHRGAADLAEELIRQGRSDEAFEVLRPAVHADWHSDRARATAQWAGLLAVRGRTQEAVDLLSAQGTRPELLKFLVRAGRSDEALRIARRWAAGGDRAADGHLADLLAELGDEEALRARAAAGQVNSTGRLAELLARRGRRDEAIALYLPYVRTERGAADRVVELLVEEGRVEEALAVLRPFVAAGHSRAHAMLAEILVAHGREAEAVGHLRAAVVRDPNLHEQWAQLCPLEELPALAATGMWPAVARWTRLLAGQGHLDRALGIVGPMADGGHVPAAMHLTELLADHGRLREALDLLRNRIASGVLLRAWWAPEQLTRILFAHGLADELRAEVDAGTAGAAELLGRLTAGETAPAAAEPLRHRGYILPEYGGC